MLDTWQNLQIIGNGTVPRIQSSSTNVSKSSKPCEVELARYTIGQVDLNPNVSQDIELGSLLGMDSAEKIVDLAENIMEDNVNTPEICSNPTQKLRRKCIITNTIKTRSSLKK